MDSNIFDIIDSSSDLLSTSALPSPAQPAKVVFPIRTYNNDHRNSNGNSTSQVVDISALHSNAFNFTTVSSSTLPSDHTEIPDSVAVPSSHNDSITTSSQKREIGTLPLEKLFSNITSNNVSSSVSSSTGSPMRLPVGNHILPSSDHRQLKSSMKPLFRRANMSSSTPGRVDPIFETTKIINSKSRANSSSTSASTNSSTTESVRRIQSTLPPSLRRWNNSSATVSRKPIAVLQRRTNDSTSPPDFIREKYTAPVVDPEDVIRQALLNHTLMHGAEEDLDRLVFSQLPEGSKLILRSVKIVKTDENGDTVEDEDDNDATAWDVTIANAKDSIYDAEEAAEAEDSDEEDKDDEPESNKNVSINVNKNDLLPAGSHESHSTANYKVYGNNLRQKEKTKNYHHGNDHGKSHKKTLTDTDGVKVTDYHGKEKGLTDFANSHGNAQSNEGGRYKDSKKKNKGRKVTGFKRVYHKEEFQRTEHFYDDEEAKRIAENYSLNDHKEKSNHGVKEDDNKHHGTRKEITDGNKVKNEYGTKNSYDKGQHESNTASEKHKHGTHYGNSKNSRYSSPQANSYHGEKDYHPNHNYKAAYSNASPVVRPQPASSSPEAGGSDRTNNIRKLVATPPVTSFTVTEYIQPDSTEDSIVLSHSAPSQSDSASFLADAHNHDEPHTTLDPTPPAPLEKPEEMKVFFSPRERPIPLENEIAIEETPYAPNFGPQSQKSHMHAPLELPFRHSHSHYRRPHQHRSRPIEDGYGQHAPLHFMDTPFYNKIGNATYSPLDENVVDHTPSFDNNQDYDAYPKNHHTTTIRNQDDVIIDPVPAVYSTIVKVLPQQFYNYTDFHNAASNIVPPESNLISIDKAKVDEIIITTSSPHHGNNHINSQATWTTYGNDIGQESKQHPNHNYGNEIGTEGGARKRIPHAHLARLHHRRRHRPLLSQRPPGPGSSPQHHFNNNLQRPAGQSSNTVLYKSRRAPLPHFMNGLMDSVANFFSKIG